MKNYIPIRLLTIIASVWHFSHHTLVSAVSFIDTNSSIISPSQGMIFATTSGLNPSTISSAGDLNGDSYGDLLIGVSSASSNAGAAYVVFGTENGIPQRNLSTMTNTEGIKISGTSSGSYLGCSVDHLGDVNGDDIDDIIIGAYGANAAYVIFGKKDEALTDVDVSTFDTDVSKGIKITGLSSTRFGIVVSGVGDINDDGINDIIIGAPDATSSSGIKTGVAYIIFGNKDGLSNMNVNSLTPEQGFKVFGTAANQQFGAALSPAGDVNKDGVQDFMVGAPSAASLTGTAHVGLVCVLYGRKNETSDMDTSSMNADQGFKIYGFQSTKPIGTKNSISSIGDINGDGADDLVIGHPDYFASGVSWLGKAYVIYGQEGVISSTIQVNALTSAQGFTITGASAGDKIGYSVASGDINNDGLPDLIVDSLQATTPSGTSSGKIYVFFGHEGGFSNISVGDQTREYPQTLQYYGVDGSGLGAAIDIAKDLNGDGVNDILATSASLSGIHILYGSKCTNEDKCNSSSLHPVCYASRGCVCGEYNKLFEQYKCVDQCSEGYYPDSSICEPCPGSCLSCTGPSTCQSCSDTFLLQETSCVSSCSTGYHLDETTCKLDETGNNSPGGENPGEGTPGEGNSGGETPGGSTPGSGNPGEGTPGEGNSGGETPGEGTSGGETPGEGNSGGETPGEGTSGGGTSVETLTAESSNMGLIIGVIVGGVVLLIAAITAFYYRRKIMVKFSKSSSAAKYNASTPKHPLKPERTEGELFRLDSAQGEPQSPSSPVTPTSPFGSPNSPFFPRSTQTLQLLPVETNS